MKIHPVNGNELECPSLLFARKIGDDSGFSDAAVGNGELVEEDFDGSSRVLLPPDQLGNAGGSGVGCLDLGSRGS